MTTQLAGIRRLDDYRAAREHLFPSPGSLTWYVRQHRRGLVEAGALLILGKTWYADEARFDAFVLKTGAAAAQRHSGLAEAA